MGLGKKDVQIPEGRKGGGGGGLTDTLEWIQAETQL